MTELEQLRAFAQAIFDDWPDVGNLDGGDLQELGIKHGLLALREPRPTAPCGENCNCIEYHGSDPKDWADGVECYIKTPVLESPLQRK